MNMTEQDRNTCQVASAALTGFSRLSLLIFITTPSIFILIQGRVMDVLTIVLLLIFLVSVLFIAFRSWHIYFDALLLRSMGYGNAGIGEVDLLLLTVFKKDLQGKPLQERIEGCYRLSRGLFVGLGIHIVLFVGMLFFLLMR